MRNSEEYENYYELVNLIEKYGEKYSKRHGNWFKLHYINDYYFVMDSWNKRIKIMQYPKPAYNSYNTVVLFEGRCMNYLGIDFGRFELRVDFNILKFYIENIKLNLGLDHDFTELQHFLECEIL